MTKELKALDFLEKTNDTYELINSPAYDICREALKTRCTLVKSLRYFRNRWCKVKTAQELNDVCGYFINEIWKDFLKESEETK